MPAPVDKYLECYAEPDTVRAQAIAFPPYEYVLVIPANRERPADVERVWENISDTVLVVLVVNSSHPQDDETIDLLRHIRGSRPWAVHNHHLSLHVTASGSPDILLVDRCTDGREIPPGQGVGLARKIGADIALELIARDVVATPVIYSTDADVRLPPNYFTPAPFHSDTAAALYPFRHEPEPGLELPATLYEISLFYYVAGLKWAQSRYAFTTVGSTIAVSKDHYAMVRGFPRRPAGEDFYLLNKLAKTGRIRQLPGPCIDIVARPSDRAPFGTGAALQKIAGLADPVAEYRFYDPEIFRLLAAWHSMLDALWEHYDPNDYLDEYPRLRNWCEETGFLHLAARRKQSLTNRNTFANFLHHWFDAFRTLKFIHFMRDRYLPSVPINEIADTEITPPLDLLSEFRDQLAATCFNQRSTPIT